MHQKSSGGCWGSLSAPPDPLAALRGGRGKGREGKGRGGKGRGGKGMGGRGKEGKGRCGLAGPQTKK